jgi:glycosyltransferase involved in cell wall biosynthesis
MSLEGLGWDARWEVTSGIGRFSREVRSRLGVPALVLGDAPPTSPAGVLDLERASWRMRRSGRRTGFVTPGFMAPIAWPGPTAVVIHDLMHRQVPGEAGRVKRAYLDTVIRRSVRHAAVVLTVSEHSRQGLIAWAGLKPDGVVTVGNGVSAAFSPHGRTHREERPYLLYVGNHKPHKNLARMFEGFALADTDADLLLSGSPDETTRSLAERFGVTGRVRYLGQASDDDLAAAYRGAVAAIIVSTHEGFGLPALEAMASGCPVIAGDRTALPEVVGDAGLLVDPEDPAAISAAIDLLATGGATAARLAAAGPIRARLWTWDAVAARTRTALGVAFDLPLHPDQDGTP